jgi:hypothetical protein
MRITGEPGGVMNRVFILLLAALCGCAAQPERGIVGRWADADDNLETLEFFADGTFQWLTPPQSPMRDPNPSSIVGIYTVIDGHRLRLDAAGMSDVFDFAVSRGELLIIQNDTVRMKRDSPRLQEERARNLERYMALAQVRADMRAVERTLVQRWMLPAAFRGAEPAAFLKFRRPEAVTINVIEYSRDAVALELRHAAVPDVGCVFIRGNPTTKPRLPDGVEADATGCKF